MGLLPRSAPQPRSPATQAVASRSGTPGWRLPIGSLNLAERNPARSKIPRQKAGWHPLEPEANSAGLVASPPAISLACYFLGTAALWHPELWLGDGGGCTAAAKAAVAGAWTPSRGMLPPSTGLWFISDGYTPDSFQGHPLHSG